jgi:outer membrane protein assembly factor BamB
MGDLPSVADGVVYFGVQNDAFRGSVYALDASTGAVHWRVSTGGQGSASPAIASGVVYIGSNDGLFSALDASTGAVRWQDQISVSEDASPVVANGAVYVGTTKGSLVALDSRTGALRWRSQPSSTSYFAFSTPVVANGVVYADSEGDQSVYALDTISGAVHWRFTAPFPTAGEFPAAPAVEQGVAYVVFVHSGAFANPTSSIYALDATTGAVRWHLYDSKNAYSAATVAEGVMYIGSTERAVDALDASTGVVRWRSSTDVAGTPGPP